MSNSSKATCNTANKVVTDYELNNLGKIQMLSRVVKVDNDDDDATSAGRQSQRRSSATAKADHGPNVAVERNLCRISSSATHDADRRPGVGRNGAFWMFEYNSNVTLITFQSANRRSISFEDELFIADIQIVNEDEWNLSSELAAWCFWLFLCI